MLESLLGAGKPPVIPPLPSNKIFLITSDNGYTADKVSGKKATANSGLTQKMIDGTLAMESSSANLSFLYDKAYTPFRRGAEIEVSVYLSNSDSFPSSPYPNIVGYMQAGGTLNYWSFGIIGPSNNRRVAFYGWKNSSTLFTGNIPITKTGWIKIKFSLTTDLVLSVDGVEHLRTTISDSELQLFISNQNPTVAVPLTFFKTASTTLSNTRTSYIAIA